MTAITARNGRIPAGELTRTRTGQPLLTVAALAYARLDGRMRAAGQGALTLTAGLSGYRTLAEQQHMRNIGLTTIAVGRSVHGEGLAADWSGLGGLNGARYRWLRANAGPFGWFHPTWAQAGGSNPSAHHWEYDRRRDQHAAAPPPPTPDPEPQPWEVPLMPWFIRRRDGAIVIVTTTGVRVVTADQWATFTNLGMAVFPPGMDNMDPGPFDALVASLGGIVP